MKKHILSSCKILLLTVAFLCMACEKEQGDIQEQGLKVKDGILTFKSETSFLETLDHLKTLSDEEIKSWLSDLQFTKSHFLTQEYYSDLPTDEDISLHEKLNKANILFIPDPAFSAVLNTEGLYRIGKEYHRITEKVEYISQDYKIVMNPEAKHISGDVTAFILNPSYDQTTQRVNLNGQTLCAKNPTNSYTGTGFYGGNYFNKYHPYPDNFFTCGGGDYSFHTQTWYTEYSNHYSVGTWIKGRKYKKKGLRKKWRDDRMTYAKINNDAASNVTRHTVYFDVNKVLHVPAIQSFSISYEYNDESKGLRRVNMTLQSIQ
ncbi:hypothetical protein [Aquimarina sp. 2201CG5-10]|uniref:hypothetical protein n=1 Tax=Aquimarina callyspongiae TaxID=3098150 RepID=UPI002AB34B45|nr:hypothetical protein [Aquimarina sp. 2201CG5-10]MDY8136988.1 hypothetical protein [Aquimarina sp. 2201CG5-10]